MDATRHAPRLWGNTDSVDKERSASSLRQTGTRTFAVNERYASPVARRLEQAADDWGNV